MKIRVTKWAYLRTPLFSAAYTNEVGGGSNIGGQEKSLRAIASYIKTDVQRGMFTLDTPVSLEVCESFDDNDEPLITSSEIDVRSLLIKAKIA